MMMKGHAALSLTVVLVGNMSTCQAFQNLFKITSFQPLKPSFISKEQELIDAISNTSNGKEARPSQQKAILNLVREMETEYSPDEDILTNPDKSDLIDGVWYLQYTSPSKIETSSEDGDGEESSEGGAQGTDVNLWEPTIAEDPKIETKQFEAKGSVSAAGITVDVSNKVPKQIFDVENGLFFNEVDLDFGQVRVGGPFKLSDKVPNRVIACFKEGNIELNFGLNIDLGVVFKLINATRGTDEGGWLETTYLTDKVRIGRGNKGTMFVLTRDKGAVSP